MSMAARGNETAWPSAAHALRICRSATCCCNQNFFCKSSRKHSEIAAKNSKRLQSLSHGIRCRGDMEGHCTTGRNRQCGIPVETHMHAAGTVGGSVDIAILPCRQSRVVRHSTCAHGIVDGDEARPPRPKAIMLSPSSCQSESGASPATLCQPTIPCTSGQRSVQLQPESLEQSISGTLAAVAPEAPESVSWNSYPENTLGVPYG